MIHLKHVSTDLMPDELGFSLHDLYNLCLLMEKHSIYDITCIDHNSYNSEFYYDDYCYQLLYLILCISVTIRFYKVEEVDQHY